METAIVNKLSNEEIARVFAMYQGQKVLCYPSDDMYSHWLHPAVLNWNVIAGIYYSVTNTILSLTPLDKITDEHAIEVGKIYWTKFPENPSKDDFDFVLADMKRYFAGFNTIADYGSKGIYIHHYLISKGYAVPLWFGIDHPCNGKNAIELGIAIDNTLNS